MLAPEDDKYPSKSSKLPGDSAELTPGTFLDNESRTELVERLLSGLDLIGSSGVPSQKTVLVEQYESEQEPERKWKVERERERPSWAADECLGAACNCHETGGWCE